MVTQLKIGRSHNYKSVGHKPYTGPRFMQQFTNDPLTPVVLGTCLCLLQQWLLERGVHPVLEECNTTSQECNQRVLEGCNKQRWQMQPGMQHRVEDRTYVWHMQQQKMIRWDRHNLDWITACILYDVWNSWYYAEWRVWDPWARERNNNEHETHSLSSYTAVLCGSWCRFPHASSIER